MRYVEFSPAAEAARTRAPIAARRQIASAVKRILANPNWGASTDRFIAPAHNANTGLIVDLSVRGWAITYRVKTSESTVWIEDIRQIMIG